MAIFNLVFDMGDVLIRNEPLRYVEKYAPTPEDQDVLLYEVRRSVEWIQMDHGTMTEAEAIDSCCRRLPARLHAAAADIIIHWNEELVPMPGMEDLIQRAKEAGYRIYLLSNTSLRYRAFRGHIPALRYFDGEFVSAEWKLLKPDPAIYLTFCLHFGLIPAQCLFVDNEESNVYGAQRAGMYGEVFHRQRRQAGSAAYGLRYTASCSYDIWTANYRGNCIMSIRFGTGGWRAVIGDDFIRSNIRQLCAALAEQLKADGEAERGFVIGYDRRFLSREAACWCAQVLAANGIPVEFIDRESPTPLIMFCMCAEKLGGGLAVTASHNPAIYNGIKVFTQGGQDANEAYTSALEKRIARREAANMPINELEWDKALGSGAVKLTDPMNEYIDSILSAIDVEAIRTRKLKVALDPMYGVSKTALQTVLITARCDVNVIHDRHDTLFGGRLPTPTVHTLLSLQNFVLENGCDIGLATDGDADRLGVIDDKAQFLHPNKILALLYYYMLRYKGLRGPAVRNIATTHLLDAIAGDFGQACIEVPVGFKYVCAGMLSSDALIGGESSGGLTVKGHIHGKDGIYAAALLVEMVAITGRSLSDLWQEIESRYGRFEMIECNYSFSAARKTEIASIVLDERRMPDFVFPIDHVSYRDGCKVYFANGGWIVVRFSGTEPLLRIFCEASSGEEAEGIVRKMEALLGL